MGFSAAQTAPQSALHSQVLAASHGIAGSSTDPPSNFPPTLAVAPHFHPPLTGQGAQLTAAALQSLQSESSSEYSVMMERYLAQESLEEPRPGVSK